MQIKFRPSGGATSQGRGEYEVSGECDGYTSRDVLGREIVLALADDWRIETGLWNLLRNGKRRIRSVPKDEYIGIQKQICIALLLASTERSMAKVLAGAKLLDYVEADHIEVTDEQLIFHAKIIVIRTAKAAHVIDVAARVAEVKNLWARASELPPILRHLVEQHHDLVTTGFEVNREAEKIYNKLPLLLADGDSVIQSEIGNQVDWLPEIRSKAPTAKPILSVEQLPENDIELRRRTIDDWREWRYVNSRGGSGRRFARDVRAAYNSTCLICGVRLPGGVLPGGHPGVDAAHILPWRDFDADNVQNGICLCKTHHWAFDASLLAIRWNEGSGSFAVFVPESARAALAGDDEVLSWLETFCGEVPESRLPGDPSQRPRPEYFQLLAHELDLE